MSLLSATKPAAGGKVFRARFLPRGAVLVAIALVVLSASALLNGCGGGRVGRFDLIDQQYVMKPGTLAVVSGNNDSFDTLLADVITRKLRSQSTLKVLSQAEIKARAKGYPSDMVGAYDTAKAARDAEYWFDQADAAKVAVLQKQLKAEYVLVVWGGNLTKQTVVSNFPPFLKFKYGSDFYARLFEFPSKRIVGYSDFWRVERAEGSVLADENNTDKGVWMLIRGGAADIVDDFLRATKTEKAGEDDE